MKLFLISLAFLLGLTSCTNKDSAAAASTLPPTPMADPSQNDVEAQGSSKAVCDRIPLSERTLTYCVDPETAANGSKNKTEVIYYFHGIFGSADDVFKTTLVTDARATMGDRFPLFVSLSLGPQGLVKDSNAAEVMAAMGQIENKFGQIITLRRDIVGASMGGYNSLRIVGFSPQSFYSASILCPALVTFDLYDNAEVNAYRKRHEPYVNKSFLGALLLMVRREFPTPAEWAPNNSFTFLQAGAYDHLKMFASVGTEDSLGFIEGTQAFVTQAQQRAIDIAWFPVSGSHCAYDAQALLNFLYR